MTTIIENIVKPNRIAVIFVRYTVGIRIIRISTSGWALRLSTMIQMAMSSPASTRRPRTELDPHPHRGPWLIPRSRATSHAASSDAPPIDTFPATRMGDSGTRSMVTTHAMAMAIAGSQNSQ